MQNNRKEILDKFVETSIFKSFITDNIILISVLGSSAYGCDLETSDFDLSIIYNCDINEEDQDASKNLGVMYKNKIHIHWYKHSLPQIIDPSPLLPLESCELMQFKYLDSDTILYQNSKYKNLIKYLLKNKNKLAKVGAINLCQVMKNFMITGLQTRSVCFKYYYHLYHAYNIIFDKENDVEFLKRVKKSFYNPISDEDIAKILEALTSILNNWNILLRYSKRNKIKIKRALSKLLKVANN